MTEAVWWIQSIDWRISSGVIFFMLLLLWGRGQKRSNFVWRAIGSCLVLCVGSWFMRFVIEEWLPSSLTSPLLSALSYSFFIMVLSLLFLGCYWVCRKTTAVDYLFNCTVALTVYRMAWDASKMITNGLLQFHLPWSVMSPCQSLFSYGIYTLVSIVCFLIYRRINRHPCRLQIRTVRLLFLIVLLCQMVLELSYRLIGTGSSARNMFLFFFTSLMYCMMSFALLLMFPYLDRLQHDNAQMENFIKSKQKYYEISREGILSLQTKCHDLKHQIQLIRSAEGKLQFDQYINRMEESIDEYNMVIETGNKCVDVVLTEKNILCLSKDIKFTYMIDGGLFNFMTEMDLYALFGNIMDNAIESMEHVSEQKQCFISMKAARRNGRIILYVENNFENELKYDRGVLVTNKEKRQHHGFGLRSIMAIAQKYGGMASIQAEDRVFKLTVTMADPTHSA
ncbi:MAG: GHKL domain-containing protein [Clostridia bacterium]